ncbi:MAG TPA: fumarylacetoacetate hydrolase family protein [Burkholderiales bacterium]
MPEDKTQRAAQWLFDEHAARRRFAPLGGDLAPADMAAAYDVQDALVALRREACRCDVTGYKVALTTPAMRKFVGYDNSIAGQLLSSNVIPSPAIASVADFGRLGFECELAFLLGADLPPQAQLVGRAELAHVIAAVAPAFELVDDRNADYASFSRDDGATVPSLAADNAWNHGVVLGDWREDWKDIDLAAVHGVLRINGEPVGEGDGRDVLGHPLEAMVWTARHLHARGRTLKEGDLVITGSLITSKFPAAGDHVHFEAAGVGAIELSIVP